MKNNLNTSTNPGRLAHTSNLPAQVRSFLVLAAALALTAAQALASELLINTNFGANGYANKVPNSWNYYAPPFVGSEKDYWCDDGNGGGECGTYYWKQWFASAATNNVAGIYQLLGSAPGSVYQADGWFETYGNDFLKNSFTWMQVSFLNASSNVLALYKTADFNSTNFSESTWIDLAITNACDVTQPISIGDPYFTNYFAVTGAVSQIVAPPGTTMVRFDICYLAGSGAGGSCYFDCVNLNLVSGPHPPAISSVFPLNMIFVPPSSNLSFTVSSPSGVTIAANNIHLSLNGTDVSSSLIISGSSSNKNALYTLLQSNQTYNVSISATDNAGLSDSASTFFQTTWVGIPPLSYLWEAEDWDFTNGMFIEFPDLCNAPGDPNCYFDKTGTPGVDEDATSDGNAQHNYRVDDFKSTETSGDFNRPNLYAADRPDYALNPFQGSEWVQYTRNFSNGFYNIYCRAAANLASSGFTTLSLVTDEVTNELGTFTINSGLGFTTFTNVALISNNLPAVVQLNGKTTLRFMSQGGNFLPTFFALVAVSGDTPVLSGLYPTGTRPFEYTNALAFNVKTIGATFPANGIQVNLDGFNVSSNLVITGSSSNKTAVYPFLQPNATHSVTITATNSLNHGITVATSFDTFDENNNFMWECEDYDYGGGQYIDSANWFPDAYSDINGPYNAETNIDFLHFSLSGEVFSYRSIGIPQDILNRNVFQDYLRQEFVNYGAQDYILVFFAGSQPGGYPGDWANYTRNYPAGDYYVYVRASGNPGTTNIMYLSQVVGGVGTTNQTLNLMGFFPDPGLGYNTFQWVPFTDSGYSAPVPIRLGGVETLRLTTEGNVNCNYFMLVPATGIRLTASRQGQNTVLSFPTQAGGNYRVFYRNSLSSGTWTLLTTVLGNGAPQQVSDPATASSRFYQVVSP